MRSKKIIGAVLSLAIVGLYTAFSHTSSPFVSPLVTPSHTASTVSAPNNNLSIFSEPESGIAPVLALIQQASSTVDIVMYQLEDPKVEQVLAADEARGVRVRVLLNEGYYGKKENTKNDVAYSYLLAHGVAVHWTPAYFTLTHQKTIVVDNKAALIMTFNLTPQYYASGREFGVLDTDTTDVTAIESTFENDWNESPVAAPQGTDLVWSPGSKAAILSLIQSATSTLDIYNEEMADKDIITALCDAAQRGVAVHVTMTYSNNWKKAFDTLTTAGVVIHTYAPKASLYIHAKAIVADNTRIFIGSENFSANSMNKNRELGIITTNVSVIQFVEKTFAGDWAGTQSNNVH